MNNLKDNQLKTFKRYNEEVGGYFPCGVSHDYNVDKPR